MIPFLLFSGIVLAWCLHAPWRRGFALLLILVVWEGALRKWVMPGASNYLLFLKDGVLCVVAIKAWRDMLAVARSIPAPLKALLVLFFGYAILEVFNPGLPSPLIGIYGVKAYLLYALLLFLVPAAFRTPDEFRHFMRIFLLLAIPALAVPFFQFSAGTDSQLNMAVRDRGYVDTFGELGQARAAGTFGYITGLAHYICFVFTWTIVFLIQDDSRAWRRVYLVVAGLSVGAAFSNGGRFPVMFVLVMLVVLVGLVAVQSKRGLQLKKLRRVALGAVLAGAAGLYLFRGAALAFHNRVETADDPLLARIWVNLIHPFESLTLFGRGIGATHSGALAFAETLLKNDYQYMLDAGAEWVWSRVMIEVGAPGTLFWLAIVVTTLVCAVRLALRLQDALFAIPAACAIYCTLNFLSNGPFDHIYAVFYWFVAGAIFAIERWSRQAPYPVFQPRPAPRPQSVLPLPVKSRRSSRGPS